VPGTSLTRVYDSVLTTTLDMIRPVIEDQISTGTKLLYFYRKQGNWKGVGAGGAKLAVPLMYQLVSADSYSGYSTLDVTPFEGATDGFWDWRQGASHVTVSGLEEFQNRDAEGVRVLDLLKLRTKQALLGLEDLFGRAMLQGQGKNDGVSITTAYTSPLNGSVFLDPLPLLVKYDPTTSTTVGSINQSTNTWWQNQKKTSAATTFLLFLKELRNLYTQCSRGPGGSPDFHVAELATFDIYETALATSHRNPDYQKADIPFESVLFKGKPVVADEFTPDVSNNSTTITNGSWYMLNSQFLGVTFDNEHNFSPGPFVTPENQDAKTAQILWYGAHWCSNRRKQGVMGNISLTISS
jgi:hypothetical protein